MNSPWYRPLKPDDVQDIDRTGRRILEQVGVHILSDAFLERLEKAGANVDRENQRVRFDGAWLDEVLSKAPSQFTLYSRDGVKDIHLGSGNSYFGNGGRVFRILDMRTGGYRYTLLRDVSNTAILVDHLKYLDFYIIACQAHDLQPETYHLNDFFRAFYRTTKHVMGGCGDVRGARQMWELASLIAGGEDYLAEKPFVSVITNVISPLTIDNTVLEILDFCIERGIPVTCAPAPISGATAPATLAGTLTQLHAESLAGVAVVQALKPGAPVLYGAVPTAMDLRTMEFTMGTVEMGMMNAAAVQLAKLYNLPIYASAGLTEAKRPDIQAGFEKLFSNFTVAMTGADYIHLAAGMLDSGNSISYEQYVIDNEMIGMIRRVIEGIRLDDSTLAYDVIEKVGPGGNYVMEEHTVDHMMDEFFYPSLSVRCNFDVWEERGRPDMLSRSREMVEQTLNEGRQPRLSDEVIRKIKTNFPDIIRF
ncbi:MAG: trimethylamine methyltransferase family protein [Dehalococcoidia bacterium]